MNGLNALSERKAHLAHKLNAVRRLQAHLDFSRHRLPYPLPGIDGLDEFSLESVSALIERFGKLQDLLGNIFREMLLLSGEDPTDMNEVLSRLEKLGVLISADAWRSLRALRNLGAHSYGEDDVQKAEFINEVAAQSAVLITTADRVQNYCQEKLQVAAG